jgi:cyanophycin synthetase
VVGGKLVAAARGEVVSITGNGRSTVKELIDSQLNSDPRRGYEEEYPLEIIDLATDTKVQLELKRQDLGADSVPAAGRQVVVQRNGNMTADCTDDVHPEVAYIAALAAKVVGLDIAGIDLVALDISRPLHEQGGAIVEVNAGPGLLMHLKPAVGAPRPVGQAIVEHLFPSEEHEDEDTVGRIPVVGVAGTRGTATIARLVAWLLHLSGRHTGLACRDGLFLDRRCVEAADSAHWEAAHRLLMNQMVQAAVIENDARTILRDGLAYDRCQVGVVTDMDGAENLAEFDIQSRDQMTKVLRTQVDVVLDGGAAVLNAADPQVADLAPLCDGGVVLYAQDASLPAIVEHRARDQGRAVIVRNSSVVLATGSAEHVLGTLSELTFGRSAIVPDTDALLAAIGAAWALDIAPDLIGAGIKTFEPELPPVSTLPA